MNAFAFVSAYKQLQPSERDFVDGFLRSLDREAGKRFERLPTTLRRVTDALDPAALDGRTVDFLSKPLVRAAIAERVQEIAAERDLTPEWIIRQYQAIASFNLEDIFDTGEDGFPQIDLSELAREHWYALQEIDAKDEFSKYGNKRHLKVKTADKIAALNQLAKITGLDKGDHADYLAYKAEPAELVRLSSSASTETLAEDYAKFIG